MRRGKNRRTLRGAKGEDVSTDKKSKPTMVYDGEKNTITVVHENPTLRQYYKAAALTGLLDTECYKNARLHISVIRGVVSSAAKIADAMLAEDAEHEKETK